tara:strand:- start:243 stop:527 length:285 start_codon:yes stop_codon:yes gene_type:complete
MFKSNKKKLVVLLNFIVLLNFFNSYYFAQTKQNSIIKLFCLNSFKEEMFKAGIEYKEEIAKKTCDCYLEEFLQTSSHQNAVTKCKLEAKEKFKS